jgi:hypothetical protein
MEQKSGYWHHSDIAWQPQHNNDQSLPLMVDRVRSSLAGVVKTTPVDDRHVLRLVVDVVAAAAGGKPSGNT